MENSAFKHIGNSFSAYLFLEFEPYLGKIKEFNNLGMRKIDLLEVIFLNYQKEPIKKTDMLCIKIKNMKIKCPAVPQSIF